MRVWKFPDQVVRIAILLVIVVAGMVVARQRFVPGSFGEIGHYRPEAVDVAASQDIKFAGWQTCVECHIEEGEAKSRSYHRNLACEVCHGAASDHAESPDEYQPVIPKDRNACLYCHRYLPSRPTGFAQVVELLHNPMKPCSSCHDPHDPTPPEVPGACSACHGQISRTKAISHHSSLDCETCHEAVPEHRQDPRSYLPRKPIEREFCGKCHAPDAPSAREIPRVDLSAHGGRYLCWQCHYPHFPEGQ
jgi:hypothetical protein